MKLEILGTGCPKCKRLTELVTEVVKELGISGEISKVEEINEIMNYGVMVTPALVVEGKVVVAGRVPSKKEIEQWLVSHRDHSEEVKDNRGDGLNGKKL